MISHDLMHSISERRRHAICSRANRIAHQKDAVGVSADSSLMTAAMRFSMDEK